MPGCTWVQIGEVGAYLDPAGVLPGQSSST